MYNGIQRARRHFRNIFNKQNSTKEASVNKNWEKWRTFFQNWTKSMTWGTFYARGSYEKYIVSNAIYLFTNPKGVSFVICQGFSRLIVFGGLSRWLVPSSIGFWNAGEFSWQKSEVTMMTGISPSLDWLCISSRRKYLKDFLSLFLRNIDKVDSTVFSESNPIFEYE